VRRIVQEAVAASEARLDARMAGGEARLVRWVTVLVLGANAVLFAVLRLTA